MSAKNIMRSCAIFAVIAGLALAAMVDTSFARGGPHGSRPTCGGDCQANKATPTATVANPKASGSVGGPNTGGRTYQQQ